jgi:hypothetical protein
MKKIANILPVFKGQIVKQDTNPPVYAHIRQGTHTSTESSDTNIAEILLVTRTAVNVLTATPPL